MFKATVVASKLREDLAHYLDIVKKNEVVQILHRGGPVRILMTQEHYLDLLSRLALYEKRQHEKTIATPSVQELEERLLKKLKSVERAQSNHDSNRVGKKRAR